MYLAITSVTLPYVIFIFHCKIVEMKEQHNLKNKTEITLHNISHKSNCLTHTHTQIIRTFLTLYSRQQEKMKTIYKYAFLSSIVFTII